MTVVYSRAWLLASQEIQRFGQAQPRKMSKETKYVRTAEINEFSRQYKSGDCKQQGQKLERWMFNEYSMLNSAKRHPHLTVGQHVSIPKCSMGEENDLGCPPNVEVRKQGVNAPLMFAVNSAP